MEQSFDQRVLEKYQDQIDICHGNYDEKLTPNSDMAVYKLDWTHFMTPEEVKKQAEELKPLQKAKYLDPAKSKRIKITREDIKMAEMMKEAETATAI